MNKRQVINKVLIGDTVEITPIDKLPNIDRQFKVDDFTDTGIIYGVSETFDGYEMPYDFFTDIKVIG